MSLRLSKNDYESYVKPAINGLKTTKIVESYHPNKAGHTSGYTPLISPVSWTGKNPLGIAT